MAVTPRIWDTNYYKASASTQSADSFVASLPVAYTRDQLRSKVWRSDGPWVVVAGWNDKLDISDAGAPTVATLTAGTYTSGSAMAAMVQAVMIPLFTAAFTVTYSTSTGKFTLDTHLGIIQALTNGANAATSGWKDIGFTTNSTLTTPITGDAAVYQSRHYLAVDLGSALALTGAQALRHNLSGGTISLKTSNTSVLNALTAGNTDSLSVTDSNTAYAYITRTNRYAAFLINDTTNTAGYAEIGVPYVGTYLSPKAYAAMFEEEGDDLSEIANATDGPNYADLRQESRAWQLSWRNLESADVTLFRSFRTSTPKGKNFFFDLNSTAASASNMVYGYRDTPLPLSTETGGLVYAAQFTMRESLG